MLSRALMRKLSTRARLIRVCGIVDEVRSSRWRRHNQSCLDIGVLIKENHIAAAGSVTKAIESARRVAPHTLKIETIECEPSPGR